MAGLGEAGGQVQVALFDLLLGGLEASKGKESGPGAVLNVRVDKAFWGVYVWVGILLEVEVLFDGRPGELATGLHGGYCFVYGCEDAIGALAAWRLQIGFD